jgi:hypothetical protein
MRESAYADPSPSHLISQGNFVGFSHTRRFQVFKEHSCFAALPHTILYYRSNAIDPYDNSGKILGVVSYNRIHSLVIIYVMHVSYRY